MLEGVVKFFKQDGDYGFAGTADGDVFFHLERCVEFRCNGSSLPVEYPHRDRPPRPGDKIVLKTSKGEKGLRADFWGYADDYQQVLQQIAARPMYRMMEREGFKKRGRLYQVGQAEPVVRWEGNNLDDLRRLFNRMSYPVLEQGHYARYFMTPSKGKWVECDDPR